MQRVEIHNHVRIRVILLHPDYRVFNWKTLTPEFRDKCLCRCVVFIVCRIEVFLSFSCALRCCWLVERELLLGVESVNPSLNITFICYELCRWHCMHSQAEQTEHFQTSGRLIQVGDSWRRRTSHRCSGRPWPRACRRQDRVSLRSHHSRQQSTSEFGDATAFASWSVPSELWVSFSMYTSACFFLRCFSLITADHLGSQLFNGKRFCFWRNIYVSTQ